MTTTPRPPFWSRNRWLLPLVLALIVAGVILGILLPPRLKSSSSSPTATPITKTVVVTATPAPGTTPGAAQTPSGGGTPAAVPPTATPGGKGICTPVPATTPVATVPGLKLCMITHPQADVQKIQSRVDSHDPVYMYYLNPLQVVQKDLPEYGFTAGFQIISPTPSPSPTPMGASTGRPLVIVVVSYQGREYQVTVAQTVKKGPRGIWQIVTILPR